MEKNYYSILDITDEEKALKFEDFEPILKKKYKKKCIQYHPDKQVGKTDEEIAQAEENFKEVNEAYSILSDKDKKQQYDMYGTVDGNGAGFHDMNDIYNFMRQQGFGGFHGFGGFNDFAQQQVVKGNDCKIKLRCTIEDLYNQVEKTIKYKRNIPCTDCNGSGGTSETCPHCGGLGVIRERSQYGNMTIENQSFCQHCNGSGKKIINACKTCGGTGVVQETQVVTIPLTTNILINGYGVVNGGGNYPSNVSLQAKTVPGNLIVVLDLENNSKYKIANNRVDLITEIPVTVIDCILGGKYTLKLVSGKEKIIDIPQNIVNGNIIKIPSEGLPNLNGGRGDLILQIKQIMPQQLTEEQRNMFNQLKESVKF